MEPRGGLSWLRFAWRTAGLSASNGNTRRGMSRHKGIQTQIFFANSELYCARSWRWACAGMWICFAFQQSPGGNSYWVRSGWGNCYRTSRSAASRFHSIANRVSSEKDSENIDRAAGAKWKCLRDAQLKRARSVEQIPARTTGRTCCALARAVAAQAEPCPFKRVRVYSIHTVIYIERDQISHSITTDPGVPIIRGRAAGGVVDTNLRF